MNLDVVSTSVVVVADQHNPTVLHPSFLQAEGIVPPGWHLEVSEEAPVCTFAYAAVRYQNGILISTEPDKFQVNDTRPPTPARDSASADVALRYIQKLPHVKYTAVGINIVGFVPTEKAEAIIETRFLKDGPWNQQLTMMTFACRFVYAENGAVLRISFDPGSAKKHDQPEPTKGLLVTANYHSDVNGLEGAVPAIGQFAARCEHFQSTATLILGIGG